MGHADAGFLDDAPSADKPDADADARYIRLTPEQKLFASLEFGAIAAQLAALGKRTGQTRGAFIASMAMFWDDMDRKFNVAMGALTPKPPVEAAMAPVEPPPPPREG